MPRPAEHRAPSLARLAAIDPDSRDVTAVVETPRGHRSKLKYDAHRQLFALHHTLPEGQLFPFDFGFVPSTRGEDGDPLDVLILMDEALCPGCVVPVRLVGVIEADQSEKRDEPVRNDRLVGVARASVRYGGVKRLTDLPDVLVEQIEQFLRAAAAATGKRWTPRGRHGAKRATRVVQEGIRQFRSRGL